jgi:hypothetical protein
MPSPVDLASGLVGGQWKRQYLNTHEGDDAMRKWWMMSLVMGAVGLCPMVVDAMDEKRQAYDRMVEESVREADAYIQRKQREAEERYADQQQAAEQEADAINEAQPTDEAEFRQGVIVRTPPLGRPPGGKPPGRPPGGRPRPTPLPSVN